jgi:putative acetyltransferase
MYERSAWQSRVSYTEKKKKMYKGFLKVDSESIYQESFGLLLYDRRKEEKMIKIKRDHLTNSEVIELVSSHLQGMNLHSPPESIHALDIESLKQHDITFWSVWEGSQLAGCGAIKELDEHHGEIKSMRTATAHLRKGIARELLQYIIDEAQKRGYRRLSLETGSASAFEPARKLYASFGFYQCEPFSTYKEDPYSVFMTKEIK